MTPAFRIVVDEHQDVTAAIRERLLALRVSDEEGYRSDTVEIRLDDRGGVVELPRRGAELQVELGYEESGRVSMGRYTVDEVELSGPPATITIRAKAADMRATLKQRKTRSWHQISIGDLVATVAAEHGIEPRTAEDLRGIVLPHVDQTDESDLHLLTRLGEQYDAEGRFGNGRLAFVRRGTASSATSGQVTPVRIAREQTTDYRVTLADRNRYRSVMAYWYDMETGQRTEVQAGDGEPVYALRDNYIDAATARAAANAKLDALNRATGTLSLTLKPGVPTVSAGSPLTLTGFREGVNGRWIATHVTHEINNSGHSTTVEAETPTEE